MLAKSIYRKQLRQRKKEQGLCIYCADKTENNHIFCTKCLLKKRENNKKLRAERKRKKLCRECGSILNDNDITYCNNCKQRRRKNTMK
jgi:hypothetical protein